jgi:two-component system chemotaxis sensor kinase CheA
VVIEIADDGHGIDLAKVTAKALERGLIGPDDVATMSERDIIALVFRPGFSTAATVTNVSGRGVGMDVVRTNVERIGGTVELGVGRRRGHHLPLVIPLTLAIIPGADAAVSRPEVRRAAGRVTELVRIETEERAARIRDMSGSPVLEVRGAARAAALPQRRAGRRAAGRRCGPERHGAGRAGPTVRARSSTRSWTARRSSSSRSAAGCRARGCSPA